MKKAVIYASSEKNDEIGIKAQIKFCRKAAEENGFEVIGEYSDMGYSCMTADRPGLKELLNNGEWTHIIVLRTSKLFRDMSLFRDFLVKLNDENKTLVTVDEHKRQSEMFNNILKLEDARRRRNKRG